MLFVFVASQQLVIMGRACIPRASTPASILHRIESKFLCLFLLDEVSLFVYVLYPEEHQQRQLYKTL